MIEGLFVIVSTMPERISKYTSSLRALTSNFLFFSDITSFMKQASYPNLRLVIIDNVDENLAVVTKIGEIKGLEALRAVPVLMISKKEGCEIGIEALDAGANDYLSFSVVDKELAARARMHLNTHEKNNAFPEADVELSHIYPLEDRMLIRQILKHVNSNISSIKRIEDLVFYTEGSARDINRVFSVHLGKTAFQYIRDLRINKAKQMLFKTRLPIIQIAQELGYSSSANFSTAFKGIVGLSPNDYRKSKFVN